VASYQPDKTQDGVTFITGMLGDAYGMKLVSLDGTTLHEWRVSFNNIWPDPPHGEAMQDWDAQIHGSLLYSNGDVVFNFRSRAAVRIDRCSNVVWRLARRTHQSVFLDYEGNLWIPAEELITEPTDRLPFLSPPFLEDFLLRISADGEILEKISVLDVIFRSKYEGVLFANGIDAPQYENIKDITHLNDIEILSPDMAARFPSFRAGDIMISLRNLNLIAVIDRETKAIKWSMVGPFLRQHDPDFLEDGRIAVFDNRRDDSDGRVFGGSRVLDVDPATREIGVFYEGRSAGEFFANIMGEHQRLANGNGLIVESERGRVFEVTPDGEIVWTYINRWDQDKVATVYHATRYPDHYAVFAQEACASSTALGR
jgi:hypothetical protein